MNAERGIDAVLIDGAILGLTAEDIAERLDGVLPVGEVVRRTRALLAGSDWLTDAERERALLRALEERLVELRRASELDAIKLEVVITRELLDRLAERREGVEAMILRFNQETAHFLGELVASALDHAAGALRAEIDPSRWSDLQEQALRVAWREVRARELVAS